MRKDFPALKYAFPGAAFVVTALGILCRQLVESQAWWAKMPWLELFVLCAVFLAGTIYADLLNRNSGLRTWWAGRSEIFDVEEIVRAAATEPPNKRWVDVTAIVKARQSVGPTTISVEHQMIRGATLTAKSSSVLLRDVSFVENEPKRIKIVHIPVAPHQFGGHWFTEGETKGSAFSGGAAYLCWLVFEVGRRKQRYPFRLDDMPGPLENQRVFILTRDDHAPR